jgi:phage-related protein
MEEPHRLKRVVWMGSSRKDLRSFPDEVKGAVGIALYEAQVGRKAISAKPLSGFGGASVLEVVQDYNTDTFRVVYTVKFGEFVCVLHAFQKKSKRGNTTPKSDLALIRTRLKAADDDYKHRSKDAKSISKEGGSETQKDKAETYQSRG